MAKKTPADKAKGSSKKSSKPKADLKSAKLAKQKENYKKLRDAGFSSTDAARYRNASDTNLKKALESKTLPGLNPKKQGAAKVKTTTHHYKSVDQQIIKMTSVKSDAIKKAANYMVDAQSQGYTYYSLTVTFTDVYGISKSFSTPMDRIKNIQGPNDLEFEIGIATQQYMEQYADNEDAVDIEINLWHYTAKSA